MQKISCLAENLLASQEGLCPMDAVSHLLGFICLMFLYELQQEQQNIASTLLQLFLIALE